MSPDRAHYAWWQWLAALAPPTDTSQMSSSARRVNLTVAHLGITIEQKFVDLREEVDRAEDRAPAQLPLDAYRHVTAYAARVEALDAWKATEPPTSFGEAASRKVKIS